jgi:hypothetical protein
MAVTVGEMRYKIKFERFNGVRTGTGGETDGHTEYLTTRGSFKQISGGDRRLELGETIWFKRYESYVYLQQALDFELAKNLRVIIRNRMLSIESYEVVNERDFVYRLILTESE